jgi:hypothetical protein
MIEVALNMFTEPQLLGQKYSGVYFLSEETAKIKDFIMENQDKEWVVDFKIEDGPLRPIKKSQDRCGYIIYQADNKIEV